MQKKSLDKFKFFKSPRFFLYSFILISTLFFVLSLFYSLRSYNDYVYGKFDLGNMNQILYNSARGNFMHITDEFGADVSRFSMSHVDLSSLIYIPFSWIYSDAAFLVVVTCVVFYVSSFLVYLISRKEGISVLGSCFNGILIYLLPITGYVALWTSFHPLLLGIPSLLLIYYLFLKQGNKKFSKRNLAFLIFAFLIFLLSKEELGFVFTAFSFYLYKRFKSNSKVVIALSVIALSWSLISFLLIIPSFSAQRTSDMNNFLDYAGFDDTDRYATLASDNFFIHRYSYLGDGYLDIAKNLIKKPGLAFNAMVSEDMFPTYIYLFAPTLVSFVLTPLFSLSLLPELIIHGLSGDSDIFNIQNHRLAIMIPLILISSVLVQKKFGQKVKKLLFIVPMSFCLISLFISIKLENPLIYPMYQKILTGITLVKAGDTYYKPEWNYILNPTCADFILKDLDSGAKVSVPQVLGAKTSNREYNAVFPTGLDKANVVIIDVLELKIANFLQKNAQLNYDLTEKMLKKGNYELLKSCNRLLLLKKIDGDTNNFSYSFTRDYDFYMSNQEFTYKKESFLKFYEFNYVQVDNIINFNYKYIYTYKDRRHETFPYTIITDGVNEWQFVHFPAFFTNAIKDKSSPEDLITEKFSLEIPNYLPRGKTYDVYFGMGTSFLTKNNLKVGTIELK